MRKIGIPLLGVLAAACTVALFAPSAHAQTFYPDDPLTAEPEPYPTIEPQVLALSEILELVSNTVGSPGERHPDIGVIEAGGVNTLGEVLDGPWFVNRHATRPLTHDELAEGPGTDHAPSDEGSWQILTIKPFGSRSGMLVADQRDRIYFLLFDSPDSPELATGAQHVTSRIMHAVGYHVGYPYSFRQEGDVPNMQVSVAENGLKADIDVDYRSSKSPGALFNGHLTSANSDVRAGDVAWWQDIFGNMPGGQQGPQDIFAAATEVPTPLPDNRPPGAVIDRPEDAVQEFLTDWLVRRDLDEAGAFMSDRAFACVNIDDDARYEALGADGARVGATRDDAVRGR